MSIFTNKKWQPMLLSEEKIPFNSKDFLFELKFDGMRAIIFANQKKVIVQNRHGDDISKLYPELQAIQNLVKTETIFDGEIISLQDGYPSFKKLQERAHLKNNVKILYQSEHNPVLFLCFDILYQETDLTNIPLINRKKILAKLQENEVFSKSRYILENGIEFYNSVKELDLEGIVAKRKDSLYEINTRSKEWIKIKNLKKEKFYISGFIDSDVNPMISLILCEKKGNDFIFVGKVTMPKKDSLYQNLKIAPRKTKSPFSDYNEEEAIYIHPIFTCYVEFMERTKNNHLRSPIYRAK